MPVYRSKAWCAENGTEWTKRVRVYKKRVYKYRVRKKSAVDKRSKKYCEEHDMEYKPRKGREPKAYCEEHDMEYTRKKENRVSFKARRYVPSELPAAKAAFKAQQANPKSKEAAALHATLLARVKRADEGNWAHHLYDVKHGYKVDLDWESIYALSASSPSK